MALVIKLISELFRLRLQAGCRCNFTAMDARSSHRLRRGLQCRSDNGCGPDAGGISGSGCGPDAGGVSDKDCGGFEGDGPVLGVGVPSGLVTVVGVEPSALICMPIDCAPSQRIHFQPRPAPAPAPSPRSANAGISADWMFMLRVLRRECPGNRCSHQILSASFFASAFRASAVRGLPK